MLFFVFGLPGGALVVGLGLDGRGTLKERTSLGAWDAFTQYKKIISFLRSLCIAWGGIGFLYIDWFVGDGYICEICTKILMRDGEVIYIRN
jgi:hypothetical protein